MRAHLEVEHCECIEGGLEVQIGSSKKFVCVETGWPDGALTPREERCHLAEER